MTYDKGINFQCPYELVENFRHASSSLESIATNRNVSFERQVRIHMSLSYLCCLRKNETDWAKEIIYEWILDNHPFSFDVTFNRLECWHERYNSVTNIIIAVDDTQKTVMKMNQQLEEKLLDRGIPTEIPRSLQ